MLYERDAAWLVAAVTSARRRENGLSSLWQLPHRILRHGCRVHAVPATWMGRPCRIRGAGAGGAAESPVTGICGNARASGVTPPACPPAHDQQKLSAVRWDDVDVAREVVSWGDWGSWEQRAVYSSQVIRQARILPDRPRGQGARACLAGGEGPQRLVRLLGTRGRSGALY